ncbi:MAG: hypothetical protein KR126chlam4_01554 [Candidatus Anoxychlamydiales bacterium]|nr:hypothetical protein [Candidatus Anoxychlamydiales bacterium]NGX41708.1 hypothetical protein [Candidatus Anoxychlamydiales bacterium]
MKLTKQSKTILFSTLILVGLSFLTFVFFKVFPSFSINEKKTFILSFIISFVLILFSWFAIKKFLSKKKKTSLVAKPLELDKKDTSVSYQELFTETLAHLRQFKKYKTWTIGCLIFGWIIIFSIKLLDLPLAQNPFFPFSLFFLLLLIGLKDLEKELALDKKIIENTLKGLKLEYDLKNSNFFRKTAKSYEGAQLFGFIFVRISPTLMILFSALNTGLGSVLEEHMPWIVVKMTFGIIIGVGALFLGRFIYFPYKRLQNISVKSF